MLLDTIIFNAIVAVVLISPPVYDPSDSIVRRLRSKDIELHGRNPCEGTGLNCAQLPVHTSDDVDSVILPRRGYSLADLRAFSRLHNLRHIQSVRSITERQYHVLNASVPATVWFYFSVRMTDGTLVRIKSRHAGNRVALDDINGDGVIDENDVVDLSLDELVPPRIKIGKKQ